MPELNFNITLVNAIAERAVLNKKLQDSEYYDPELDDPHGYAMAETVVSDEEKTEIAKRFEIIDKIEADNKKIVQQIEKFIEVDSATSSLLHNLDDYNDHDKRYISIDAHRGSDKATDIAFMQILDASDTNIVIFPTASMNMSQKGITNKFKQFVLTSIQESSQERMQIAEGSKEYALYFFGSKPEVIGISGILKNTQDNPWSMNMLFVWENYMRGTVLAEKGWIFRLYADGVLYEGYPFNFSRNKSAGQDFMVPFNFNFVVKRKKIADLTNSNTELSKWAAQDYAAGKVTGSSSNNRFTGFQYGLPSR